MCETKDTSYLSKFEQLEVVLATNPAEDEDHVWIRTVEDVLTYEEAVSDTFGDDIVNFTPDYTAMAITLMLGAILRASLMAKSSRTKKSMIPVTIRALQTRRHLSSFALMRSKNTMALTPKKYFLRFDFSYS